MQIKKSEKNKCKKKENANEYKEEKERKKQEILKERK